MPNQIDFNLPRDADAVLTLQISPPTNTSGWYTQFQMTKRFGSTSGLIIKSCASGFNGLNVSGMSLTDGQKGIFQIAVNSIDTSGLQFGAYAHVTQRLDSGSRTTLVEGFMNIVPGGG